MLLPFTINADADRADGDPPSDPPSSASLPQTNEPLLSPRGASENAPPASGKTASEASILRAVFDASPLPIVALDANVRVMLWNQAAERLFGWRASEAIGRKPSPELMELCRRALSGETLTSIDATQLKRDASPVRVRVSIAALPTEGGAGVVAIFSDVE
jgi:PAS domain S-box-containing protein